MKVKKFLTVLAAASAVLFGQVATSEAHADLANKSAFTFCHGSMSETYAIVGIQKPAFMFASEQIKFNYVTTTLKYVCDRCGKIITVSSNVNPNYPPDGLAYGCPGTGGKNYKRSFTKNFKDRHFWRWVTD